MRWLKAAAVVGLFTVALLAGGVLVRLWALRSTLRAILVVGFLVVVIGATTALVARSRRVESPYW